MFFTTNNWRPSGVRIQFPKHILKIIKVINKHGRGCNTGVGQLEKSTGKILFLGDC